jgi:hypothetical protein
VELEVVSDQKYAELLAAGSGDAGSDEQSVAVVLESSGGGGKATVVDSGKAESPRSRFAVPRLVSSTGTSSFMSTATVDGRDADSSTATSCGA